MKKLLSLLLAACLLASLVPGVFAAEASEIGEAATLTDSGASDMAAPEEASGAQPMATPYTEPPAPRDVSASGTVTETISWTLENGVLTVSGSGEIPHYGTTVVWGTEKVVIKDDPPWESYKNDVLEIRVESGITRIGTCAFSNMGNLQKASIAGTVKTIWRDAFCNAWKLSEINLNEGTEQIRECAFYNACPQTLRLPSTVTDLDVNALNGLWNTENFVVAPGNPVFQSIDGVLFTDGGKTLFRYPAMHAEDYTVPEGTTKIAMDGFSQNHLKAVTLPDSLTEIGQCAFDYSEDLTSITIPEQVKRIEGGTFWSCKKLQDVYVPDGMTFIAAGAVPDGAEVHVGPASLLAKLGDGSWARVIPTGIYGTACFDDAFRVLDLVNRERAANSLAPLTMDMELLSAASLRAAELVVSFSHTRPDGTRCFTASKRMMAENIAMGADTPESVMSLWMNSEGHRANILNPDMKTIGIACLRVNGTPLWVQCFGDDLWSEAQHKNYPATLDCGSTVRILADKEHFHPVYTAEKTELQIGETAHVLVLWMGTHMDDKSIVVECDAPDVIEANDGVDFVAVGPGTAQITVYPIGAPDLAQTFTMRVKDSGAATPDPDNRFSDVPDDAWFSNAVAWAVQNGVTAGTSETTFSPDMTCTRAQVVTFLWRSAGSPAVSGGKSFADVAPGSYYETAVQWAVEQGVTVGVSDTRFDPDGGCTRAQVVTFLHRAAKTPAAAGGAAFADVPSGTWFAQAVSWAVEQGITVGVSDTQFGPDNACTRAQIVSFLYRFAAQ
ncbi:MAG: S-layer homology domain-containing protein [Oscillospiraceae bacterium]|nr:S-layer homology domain-containing protein [Oscillospiraceae bacterium]